MEAELKKKKKTQLQLENEQQVRQSWDKGDEVEIFSNTHQEWYLGEVVDIIKDDEGEWLNCVWARANGEAMSKQVQRFSTDVRPIQDDHSTSGSSSDETATSPKDKSNTKSPAEKIQDLAKKIAQRKTNFRRRAPPFSRTLRPSTFTYPATSGARRSRKLLDLEETQEKNQHVVDSMPSNKRHKLKRLNLEIMKPQQVREFIRSMGSAYERYTNKFRNVKGSQLVKFNENSLQKFGVNHKLHRLKILLEIEKNKSSSSHLFESDIEVLNWTPLTVKEFCSKHSSKLISIYAQKFFNHGIDGMLLFDLDQKDLTTIGIQKIHQQRVLDIILKFKAKTFPESEEEEKDPESSNNGNSIILNDDDNSNNNNKRTRGSVAHIDVSQLNGNMISNGVGNNNDAIIYTMGQLLLELGKMFSVGKIQKLTSTLERQLVELQQNSVHPQMLNRESLNVEENHNNDHEGDDKTDLILKMSDRVNNSPTGLDSAAAWIKTNMGAKGHKRRSSLPYINAPIDEEDDDEDISDIE
eukprot:84973_1